MEHHELVFDPGTTLPAAADVLAAHVGSEAVVLSQQSGVYYGLNEVAARVWQLAEAGRTLQQIRATLLAEFDVEEARLSTDLNDLVATLVRLQLVIPGQQD